MKKSADTFCAITVLICTNPFKFFIYTNENGHRKAAFNPGGNSLKKLYKEALKQDFARKPAGKKGEERCCKVEGLVPHF